MDESQSPEALSDVLTRISANPYDLSLHAQHLQLATASGMEDQVAAARRMLTEYWPAGDEVWIPIVEARIRQGVDSLQDVFEALALFQTAEEDYLSMVVLQKHVGFLIDRHDYFTLLNPKPEDLGDIFSPEWTRMMLEIVVKKGAGHLTKGHLLWNPYFDWEMTQLETQMQEDDRTNLILRVEDMLLQRLKQPHATHEETFQFYSTFTTNYKPANIYEKLLVTASKLKAAAVKAYERREQFEQFLEHSDYSLDAYNHYLSYEHRARKIDLPVISMLYERAITDTAKGRFSGAENAETALRVFWLGYCDVLRTENEDDDRQRTVLQRAVRSIPGSGAIWARYLRFLESTEKDVNTLMQSTSEICDKAFSTGLLQKDVEEIVPVVLAQAGLIKRAISQNDEVEGFVEALFKVLDEGIKMVREASHQGDPRCRLENFLAELYVNLAASPDLASAVLEATAKHSKSSYLAWIRYIESLTKQEKYEDARVVFKDIVNKRLDWPEMVFDAWTNFEHLHGTLEDIYECLDKVERAQNHVNFRRAKEAEKAALQAAQTSEQADRASTWINEAAQQVQGDAKTFTAAESSMDVDKTIPNLTGKRKYQASEDKSADGNKKAKTATPAPLKRDRENSTVFIADLLPDVSENDLSELFKDCGGIREIKISSSESWHVATVEFFERESVPAALTKNKKRIGGQEISVHLAWQSTLYVTNFPEKADDAFIRQLFDQFGHIFDVRWPSKKFKASRRFCYVQFLSKDAAQAALLLHGKELESGLAMNVFISDPERKKERTDASTNEKEVYVAGLSKFVTENDLEKIFKTYGSVKDIRITKDDAGLCKGVAFIDFENEASARRALQANNYDLKNRRIAVTLSDSRVRARRKDGRTESGLSRRDDVQTRSVRIKGLPEGTQEGLLQQTLEKVVPVKCLEVFPDSQEAIAELESAADAGKLLLLKDPLQFGGKKLQISEEFLGAASKRAPQPKAGVSMFLPRNAPSKPRAGLGFVHNSSSTARNDADKSAKQPGKSQDDFRKLLG